MEEIHHNRQVGGECCETPEEENCAHTSSEPGDHDACPIEGEVSEREDQVYEEQTY